jgi:hypothetical protein
MRIVAVHALGMPVGLAKTGNPKLIGSVSVVIVMGRMAIGLIQLRFYVLGSLAAIMAGFTAHLLLCLPVTLEEHMGDHTTSIIISVGVMAVVTVAVIIIGRPRRR